MKTKKLIPITASTALVASFAPIALSSCAQYHFINVLNGFTPGKEPIEEHQFKDYNEVCQYYCQLDKQTLTEDYIWSLGEYVKENMEFPEPVFPFKFEKIDEANISVEKWWTQPYPDENIKNVFLTSYSTSFQFAGQTMSRNAQGPLGSYLLDSYAIVSITTDVSKLPYTIRNKAVTPESSSNKTDARWILELAPTDILKSNSDWTISATTTITYKKKVSHDQSMSTTDTLGVYWHKDNMYDPVLDPQRSYLYSFVYDSLVYGSYHLKNCTLEN